MKKLFTTYNGPVLLYTFHHCLNQQMYFKDNQNAVTLIYSSIGCHLYPSHYIIMITMIYLRAAREKYPYVLNQYIECIKSIYLINTIMIIPSAAETEMFWYNQVIVMGIMPLLLTSPGDQQHGIHSFDVERVTLSALLRNDRKCQYGSGRGTVAVLLPGFAINW